jgi:nucleobase:cation symporter-1, NCS1 family
VATTTKTRGSWIEELSIHYVPVTERHGKPRDQFTVWFAANLSAIGLFLGSLSVVLGLTLPWAIVAIAVGYIFGALIVAFHAMQGPKLGVPQMIQSRGQFGFYGAGIFFLATFVLEFGYTAAQTVLQGQAMNQVVPHLSILLWIFIFTVPTIVLAIFGYDWVHRWQRWATIVLGITVVVMLIQALMFKPGLSSAEASWSAPQLPLFTLVTAIYLIAIASWAPNVSDYSRYLPEKINAARTFWAIFWGMVASGVIAGIGAYITALLPKDGLFGAVDTISGPVIVVIMALSLIGTNVLTTYTGMLSLTSAVSTFRKVPVSQLIRIAGVVITAGAALVAAALGYNSFLTSFQNFLDVLLFVFIPWSAVNLFDYYFVRKGVYNVQAFFDRKGEYRGFRVIPVLVYLVGLGVELLFINQTFYVGPLVKPLGGVDISWIVGFVVPFGLYWLIARLWPETAGVNVAIEHGALDVSMETDFLPNGSPVAGAAGGAAAAGAAAAGGVAPGGAVAGGQVAADGAAAAEAPTDLAPGTGQRR